MRSGKAIAATALVAGTQAIMFAAGSSVALGVSVPAFFAGGPQAQIARVAQAPFARAASTAHVRDEGHLRFHSVAASSIVDEGPVSGTIPGKGRVDFLYDGSPKVTARFSILASNGTIYGEAHCQLKDPTSLTPSFQGRLTITGGSGRYAHAKGSGNLYGVFHRRGYAIGMQAVGELSY